MKEREREFRYFSVIDFEKEMEYLKDKHKAGWELTKIKFPGIYFFRKCEPENVLYRLDCNQNDYEMKGPHYQSMTDSGWKYVTSYAGLLYLKKTSVGLSNIQEEYIDSKDRLDFLKKIFWKKCISLFIIFIFAVILPLCSNIRRDLFSWISILLIILFVLYMTFFCRYVYYYTKCKKQCKKQI